MQGPIVTFLRQEWVTNRILLYFLEYKDCLGTLYVPKMPTSLEPGFISSGCFFKKLWIHHFLLISAPEIL
jgi:hypothetical protein